MAEQQERVYRVAELTRLIRVTLEDAFGTLWVEGEITDLRAPSQAGHIYFSLKDADAQMRAVLFRGNQAGMRLDLRNGMQVRAFGELTVYERSGQYQLIVRKLMDAGKGALHAKFEALKAKLEAEGLFDAGRKRPLPFLPRRVGIVTSPTGAAIRDILKVLGRRFPNVHVLLAPARVQGEGAAEEIAAGLDLLNALGGIDVAIVGRGGGSLEDLWAFNEEVVARAIARSAIPVISAVGHEIDFTISDFVADVRAPTPSAAAEIVVERKEALEDRVAVLGRHLRQSLRGALLEARNRLLAARSARLFERPQYLLREYSQRVDGLAQQMEGLVTASVKDGRARLATLPIRAAHSLGRARERRRMDVERLRSQLRALDPLAVLQRGYSVTRDEQGKVLRDAKDVKSGQRLSTLLGRGEVISVAE